MIQPNKGRKIGIMGGTFDPIHYGHLMLAEQIRTSFHLDEVIFIPVGKAPHKTLSNAAQKDQRFEMVKLAVASNPYFSLSDIEIKQSGTTYTIDTITELQSQMSKEDELFFITGADAILLLESWKDYQSLVKKVKFIGATRPGYEKEVLEEKIRALHAKYGAQIELSVVPALAISSTDIRDRVYAEKSIKYLLPEVVENYIHENFLYKEHHERFFEFKQLLEETLSKKRFLHSLETAHTARKLALQFNVDPLKAEFAGLCHDFAKEIKSKKMQSYIEAFGIYQDPSIIATPNIAHGEVAAGILKAEYGIEDEEILDAIKWHTYGNKAMSDLSKIIYISDIIEPTRDFEGVVELRKYAYMDLDLAIVKFYSQCTPHLEDKHLKMHRYTTEMVKQILDSQERN